MQQLPSGPNCRAEQRQEAARRLKGKQCSFPRWMLEGVLCQAPLAVKLLAQVGSPVFITPCRIFS